MDVRAHLSMLFHLDKCIGCHTCSVACKNLWTDRRGAEYMWWNNVETRPGTGYPTGWENQKHYGGGWQRDDKGKLGLALQSRPKALANLFFNHKLPELDDYYEPFTFRYEDLFSAPESDDQPTAIPISQITREPMEIEGGPNWDDDLSGSNVYARNDPSLDAVPEEIRRQLDEIERVVFNYLPRICNHCLNPACIGSCPSGAIYKRAEDGVVLVNENKCRACGGVCGGVSLQEGLLPGRRVSRRSASSASRAWRPVRHRLAPTRASVAFATWGCCCTTPSGFQRRRRFPTIGSSRRKATSSSTLRTPR